MRALVLAAGRGSRMGAATVERPKGMLELGGRTLIEWQLTALRATGVAQVAIVSGYGSDLLPQDLPTFHNPEWERTTQVRSLACARDWLAREACLVTYADLVYPAQAVRRLVQATDDVAVLFDVRWRDLWSRRFVDPLTDAETFRVDDGGALTEIGRRPRSLEEVEGQFMGLLRLEPLGARRLLDRFEALPEDVQRRTDLTALLDLEVRAGERIAAVPYDGWWCEVDRPEDLAVAEAIVAREVGT